MDKTNSPRRRLCIGLPVVGVVMSGIALALSLTVEAPRNSNSLSQREAAMDAYASNERLSRVDTSYAGAPESREFARLRTSAYPQPEVPAALGASLVMAGVWFGRQRK